MFKSSTNSKPTYIFKPKNMVKCRLRIWYLTETNENVGLKRTLIDGIMVNNDDLQVDKGYLQIMFLPI